MSRGDGEACVRRTWSKLRCFISGNLKPNPIKLIDHEQPTNQRFSISTKTKPRGRIDKFGILQMPKKVAECAEGVVRDRPVHQWARGARARRHHDGVRPHKMSGWWLACFRVGQVWVAARSDAPCVCMCARGRGNALFEHVFRSCGMLEKSSSAIF